MHQLSVRFHDRPFGIYCVFHVSAPPSKVCRFMLPAAFFSQPRREPPTGLRFAPAKLSPGGKSSRVAGVSPRRLTDEVTLLCAIPAFRWTANCLGLAGSWPCFFFSGGERLARVNWFELLSLTEQAGSKPQSSPAFARALFSRSNARLHHTGKSCAANKRPELYQRAARQAAFTQHSFLRRESAARVFCRCSAN